MIRVLVDGRKINDGGIGTYTRTLILGLIERGEIEIGVIAPEGFPAPGEWGSRVVVYPSNVKKYSLSEYFRFPPRELALRYDLFHVPHYTTPFFSPIPIVATVHDIIHFTHPERWYYRIASFILLSICILKARRIIAVSKATQNGLHAVFGWLIKRNKITVIPNPVKIKPSENSERVGGKYLLAVSSQNKPHKGVENLVNAYRLFCERCQRENLQPPNLVLAGSGTRDLIVRDSNVEVRGLVSEVELERLYKGAIALVVPSLAEGFCLPAIEAHAVGTPIVATPVPAILEIISDGDSVATGFSDRELSDAIYQHLTLKSGGSSEKRAVSGVIERFAPQRVAERTYEVYRLAVGNRG